MWYSGTNTRELDSTSHLNIEKRKQIQISENIYFTKLTHTFINFVRQIKKFYNFIHIHYVKYFEFFFNNVPHF